MTIYGYKMAQKGIGTPNEYDTDAAFIEAIKKHKDGHCVIMLHAASLDDIRNVTNIAPKNCTIVVVSETVAAEYFFPENGIVWENVYLLNRSIPTQNPQDNAIVEAFGAFYGEIKKLDGNAIDSHQAVSDLVKEYIDGKSHIEEKNEALKYISSLGNGCDD